MADQKLELNWSGTKLWFGVALEDAMHCLQFADHTTCFTPFLIARFAGPLFGNRCRLIVAHLQLLPKRILRACAFNRASTTRLPSLRSTSPPPPVTWVSWPTTFPPLRPFDRDCWRSSSPAVLRNTSVRYADGVNESRLGVLMCAILTVSAGFATVHGNNTLTINAVEAYEMDSFSPEVRCFPLTVRPTIDHEFFLLIGRPIRSCRSSASSVILRLRAGQG